MHNRSLWYGCVVSAIAFSIFAMAMGCRRTPAVAGGVASVAVDSLKDTLSPDNARRLDNLYVSGAIILLCALLTRFVFAGSWRDAVIISCVGLIPSAGAFLLSAYPRAILLIPAFAALFLLATLTRRVMEWWTGYRAWIVTSAVIEKADTGAASSGQKIKNRLGKADKTGLLDKALKFAEGFWEDVWSG